MGKADFRSRAQTTLFRSRAASVVGRLAARRVARQPVEQWPAWLGALTGIRVPKRTGWGATDGDRIQSGNANIDIILELLDMTRSVEGDIAECGVFQGATLVPIAAYVRQHGLDKRVFGLDSFRGFDASVSYDIGLAGAGDSQKRLGGFDQTSAELVQRKIDVFDLGSCVELLDGYFVETLPRLADRRFSFVHLDCDIYESYKTCLTFFYPRLTTGGVILLDEYNDPAWPGCNEAADEFVADKPEQWTEMRRRNFVKYYIQKH